MDKIEIIEKYIEECIGDPHEFSVHRTAKVIDALYNEPSDNVEPSYHHLKNILGAKA